ncbi:MAG: hypothetical protein ACXVA9_04355 [Bdellovibrionales bacterium]
MTLLAFLIGSSLWAAEPSKSIDIVDPAWGKFTIKVADEGKPAQEPIRVDLTVLCKDQREKPTSVLPKPEELMKHDKICAFDKYSFDKEQKILTLQFTTSETEENEAKCKKHWKQDFEMKKICASWTSPKVLK